MKKALKILAWVLLVLVGFGAMMSFIFQKGMDHTLGLEIGTLHLSSIEDGIYQGSAELNRWSNTVEVEVKDHKIIAIKVVKDVLFHIESISANLFESVIENQSLDVDVETGATATSKAYLKAIELALE